MESGREATTEFSPRQLSREADRALGSRDYIRLQRLLNDLYDYSARVLDDPYQDLQRIMLSEKAIKGLIHGDLLDFSVAFPEVDAIQIGLEQMQQLHSELRKRRAERIFELAGPTLEKAWKIIIDEYPEFRHIEVLPSEKPTSAYYNTADIGRSEAININFDVKDSFFRNAFVERAASLEIIAERIGIPLEQMTIDQFKVFVLAHELGHAHDFSHRYRDQEGDGLESWKERRKREMRTLFIPGNTPAHFNRLVKKHPWSTLVSWWPQLRGMTPQEAMRRQDQEYRQLPAEKYADDFAAFFMQEHWEEIGL